MLGLPHNTYKLTIKRQKRIIELLMYSYFSFEIIKVHPDFVKEYTSYRNKPVLIHREKYENFTGKISG